jgi:hypothetical protein
MATDDPADLLHRMLALGTKIFAVSKERVVSEDAKRVKKRKVSPIKGDKTKH